MTSFLQNALAGNPFSTSIGARIEQATDGSLASENWALNIEICDLINETEDGPKDAIRAIRKRLTQSAGKNYPCVMYTLTVLETCVKNCGKRFHVLVCTKDFIQELVKLIGPKNDPPTAVQEKVLMLIQSWADAFKNQPEMSGVVSAYQELCAKGIEFPATDLDTMAPIHTPRRTVSSLVESKPAPASPVHPVNVPSPTGSLNPEQKAKLQSELDIVQSNMNILGELLSEMKPGEEQPDELELLQELNTTCHNMQERIVDLISRLANDEITADLLRINDDMNNLFLRYSRWEKNKGAGNKLASSILAQALPAPVGAKQRSVLESNDSLIDFDNELPQQLGKLSTGNGTSSQLSKIDTIQTDNMIKDDFDMFAESRKVSYESSKTSGSTYKDNREPDQADGLNALNLNRQVVKTEEMEFHEMANWLGATGGTEESLSSSEFEKFLAERAAAVDTAESTNSSEGNRRQKTGSDEKKGLLAL